MVRAAARFFLFTAFIPLLISRLWANDPGEYKVGDAAQEDIITPIPLVVIDAEATKALRQKEAEKAPVYLRFYPKAADEAGQMFEATFKAARSSFLDAVEKTFGHRNLSAAATASAQFQELAAAFQNENKFFFVSTNLAALWAEGVADSPFETVLGVEMRAVMGRRILSPEALPSDIKIGGNLRLISVADTNELITAQLAEQRSVSVSEANLVPLQRAKAELQGSFPSAQQSLGRFVASFVQPNCSVDVELTRELRAKRIEPLWVADHYDAGQTIVKRGQIIDQRIQAALAQLKEKMALGQLQQQRTTIGQLEQNLQQVQSNGVFSELKTEAALQKMQQHLRQVQWQAEADKKKDEELIEKLGFAGSVLLVAIGWVAKRRRQASFALVAYNEVMAASAGAGNGGWQQRALAAEQRMAKMQSAARAGLIVHLARLMSDKLAQKLISQRVALIDMQMQAVTDLAELVKRLENVHAPLQERLLAYEQRIAELEKELAAKAEENRELIKAKIQFTRKQLTLERSKNELN
jgi:7TM-HD extracellular protein